ncbi:uncharacterized protein I303_100942 [Kwoniella dejecticola CBS 10117]|uniref:NADH:ubiquinone oxidoreductase intermediate-associated protein 30 domain-containing protein n=1 Tax=Kwoniella dejecticola CBS 10117 TaxID=1296121 RepID=A0A1A6AGD2_9TREE|nr:uncharacterized protein I303_00946 [Kwoniella dejecticola CBS 10117]OBR89124.1 hypothetical protein I303_00946 [Kwoniella dejecticola CBS 10117]
MYSSSSKTEMIFPLWHFDQWRAVDDRVRGGSSVSHLDPVGWKHESSNDVEKGEHAAARFWGNLDIETLGGAGFASQAYRYGPSPLKLPQLSYSGISLHYQSDPQTKYTCSTPTDFTFILKTTPTANIPKHPKTPGPPREAQLTYEATFSLPHSSSISMTEHHEAKFKWKDFKATYRGRHVPEGDEKWVPLDPALIYELSIMCRSDFGKQHGDFGVVITAIEAIKKDKSVELWDRVCGWWNSLSSWISGMFSWKGKSIRLEEVEDEEKRLIV